jgi:hypothetical protein
MLVVVLAPGCLLRPEMDWCGSFLLSFFLFYLELQDKDSVVRCLGGGLFSLTLKVLEADLFLPLLFLGLGGGDLLLTGDLGALGLFLMGVEHGTSVILCSESLLMTV